MGGGTGWILDEIIARQPEVHIDYVEASEKMITLSAMRPIDYSCINLIHGDESQIPQNQPYDIVITNFFLDVFEEQRLIAVLRILNSVLSPNGVLICSDFQKSEKFHQRVLLKAMHLFFRLSSNMDSKNLKDLHKHIQHNGFKLKQQAMGYDGLLFSNVYTKD